MTDISLITSLYRARQYLPRYVERASQASYELRSQGIELELLIVANDAEPQERVLLDAFAASEAGVQVLYVERETLYASWNRGIKAASGEVIGFWNADDARTSAGLVEGLRRLRGGCELVYFTFEIYQNGRKLRDFAPTPSEIEVHRRRMQAGPFFMFRRELYERVGPFDERFRIIGDWEWCVRALAETEFCHSNVCAGQFFIHGGNLSNLGSTRDRVESNVVRLLTWRYDELVPVPPREMREVWSLWAVGHSLPELVAEKLWGEGAEAVWEKWQRDEPRLKRKAERQRLLRALPKWLIDRMGLRPILAKLGLVRARKPQ